MSETYPQIRTLILTELTGAHIFREPPEVTPALALCIAALRARSQSHD